VGISGIMLVTLTWATGNLMELYPQ